MQRNRGIQIHSFKYCILIYIIISKTIIIEFLRYSILIEIISYSRAFASILNYATVDLGGKERTARSALRSMGAQMGCVINLLNVTAKMDGKEIFVIQGRIKV